jgi:hypothetical protein
MVFGKEFKTKWLRSMGGGTYGLKCCVRCQASLRMSGRFGAKSIEEWVHRESLCDVKQQSKGCSIGYQLTNLFETL